MIKPIPVFQNEAMERRHGFARAVRCGDMLFVSGTVSVNADGQIVGAGSMQAQVEQVYTNLREVLAKGGASPASVVKETIFVTDIDLFLRESAARHLFYAAESPPATTGVEVSKLALPGLLVEIELIALAQD